MLTRTNKLVGQKNTVVRFMLYCVSNNLFHFYLRKRFKDDGYMMSLAKQSQANFPKSNKEQDRATNISLNQDWLPHSGCSSPEWGFFDVK